jgi:prophage regulatory protein
MDVKDDKQRELPLGNPESALTNGPHRILRLKQVKDLTGLCRSSIYQLQAQKRFPQSVKIGPRAVGWVESAVQRWVAEKVQQSKR